MKKKSMLIQEGDLHAYVDNQLSEEKTKAVEALMQKDQRVAKQIRAWQQQNKYIVEHYNKEQFNEVPERLNIRQLEQKQQNHRQGNRPNKNRWLYSMAASLALIITSGLTGWFAHDFSQLAQQNGTHFVSSAISAYQVFSVEVTHPVEVDANDKSYLLAWLSKRIDHPLKAPDLETHGYKLLGGRLLPMRQGRTAAQLMFEDDSGQRIAWLVSKKMTYKDRSFLFDNENGINSVSWMDANVAYSVTGEISRDELHKLTQEVYKQVNEKISKRVASL